MSSRILDSAFLPGSLDLHDSSELPPADSGSARSVKLPPAAASDANARIAQREVEVEDTLSAGVVASDGAATGPADIRDGPAEPASNLIVEVAAVTTSAGETLSAEGAAPAGGGEPLHFDREAENVAGMQLEDEEEDESLDDSAEEYALVKRFLDKWYHDPGPLDKRWPFRRDPSLYWEEKILLVVDYFQIFSLLWLFGQRWNWPFWFSWYTAFAPIFLIDIPALNAALFMSEQINKILLRMRSPSGEPGSSNELGNPVLISYEVYSIAWLLVPAVLFSIYRGVRRMFPNTKVRMRITVQRGCIVAARVLFLPCAMAYFRLFFCGNKMTMFNYPMTVFSNMDSTTQCWASSAPFQLAMQVLGLIAAFVMNVAFPCWHYWRTRRYVVYLDSDHHEDYLQWREMTYMLHLSGNWGTYHYHMFSSFRLHMSQFHVWMMCIKLSAVIFYFFLGNMESSKFSWLSHIQPTGSNVYVIEQSLAVFLLLVIGLLLLNHSYPFRCMSSNIFLIALNWANIINAFAGFVLARGVTNALFSEQYIILWMGAINIIGLSVCILVSIFYFIRLIPFHRLNIPSIGIIVRFQSRMPAWMRLDGDDRPGWPVQWSDAFECEAESEPVIKLCRDVRNLVANFRLQIPEFWRPDKVFRYIERSDELRKHPIFGDRLHILRRSLEDALEDLLFLQHMDFSKTVLPYPPLQRILPQFRKRIQQRTTDLFLHKPWKSRLLLKLLALRAFTDPIRGVDYGILPKKTDAALEDLEQEVPATQEDFLASLFSPSLQPQSDGMSAFLRMDLVPGTVGEAETPAQRVPAVSLRPAEWARGVHFGPISGEDEDDSSAVQLPSQGSMRPAATENTSMRIRPSLQASASMRSRNRTMTRSDRVRGAEQSLRRRVLAPQTGENSGRGWTTQNSEHDAGWQKLL